MSITITIAGDIGAGKSIVAWAVRRALNVLGLAEVKVIDTDPEVLGLASENAMYLRWHRWARNANLLHTPVIISTQCCGAGMQEIPEDMAAILARRLNAIQVGAQCASATMLDEVRIGHKVGKP